MQSSDDSSLAQQLTTLLSRYPVIKLAILFGSQADPARTKHFDSDIDLAIMTAEPISSHFKMELIQAISTELDRPVDIVVVNDAPEPILGEVLKGQRLLGDHNTYAQLLTRHLLNVADFLPLRQRILKERRDRWMQDGYNRTN
ncbi:nucleotidyltransferase domain-containing protein [Nitrosomonas sp.]|uniref:type VII toxin-antitoxin system MntA family adenylyltransferase antitoxin n=1 Tax=Nitrosomonas sp. TaxID=42353 RepID=UPI0025D951F5|nr:nucleotidyltransferase domain-containing protein [Nitrosomonas sp.]